MQKLLEYLFAGADYRINAQKKMRLLRVVGGILLCANGFAFLNYMPKHDAINHMFSFAGEWEVRLGRFLQPYYAYLRGNVVSPWLVGVIGSAFALMSVLIILDILQIKNQVYEILAGGFLVANLTVTELCGIYLYIYDCCMIAVFFACLSVWCWMHIRHPWNIVLGAICLVLSMGFYQAYISVTIALCVVILLQKTLADTAWRAEIRSAASMMIMTAVSCATYLLLYKTLLSVWHTTPTDGSNGMLRLAELSAGMIIQNIMNTYANVFGFFVTNSRYFGGIVCALHGMLLLIVAAGFVSLLWQKKLKIFNVIAAIVLVITLPICCNFTSVIQGGGIVLRSSYALYLLFPVGLMIISNISSGPLIKQIQYIAGFICVFLLIRNVQYSNTAYMYARVTYDRTVSIMTRVLEDVEEYEGYESGKTQVAVIGEFSGNYNVAAYKEDRKFVNGLNKTSTTYPQTTYNFWRSMGSPINSILDSDVLKKYAEMDSVKEMPCYPYDGYCQMIEDVLVVKIADN